MFATHTKIMPAPAVLATSVEDEGVVLLHLQTSRYYSLNSTGAQIWQGIQVQQTVGELSRGLVDSYAISEREADTAVRALLTELAAETLIQVEAASV